MVPYRVYVDWILRMAREVTMRSGLDMSSAIFSFESPPRILAKISLCMYFSSQGAMTSKGCGRRGKARTGNVSHLRTVG